MPEIDLNLQFSELLKHHGIRVDIDNDFINTDLPDNVRFKATAIYKEVNNNVNSRLDVLILTGKGEEILESCGDIGTTTEEAINNNFQNFSSGSLHPLLAALGSKDVHSYGQVTFEEWDVNGKTWNAYIGNLVPKIFSDKQISVLPPSEFFDCFERGIKAQSLSNRLHWFRGYYSQLDNEIVSREFLVDNEVSPQTDFVFGTLPVNILSPNIFPIFGNQLNIVFLILNVTKAANG